MGLMTACGNKQEKQTMNKENNALTAFSVKDEFEKNGFSWFTENLVVCCGDSSKNNAMTIGWGSIGNYLGHDENKRAYILGQFVAV